MVCYGKQVDKERFDLNFNSCPEGLIEFSNLALLCDSYF